MMMIINVSIQKLTIYLNECNYIYEDIIRYGLNYKNYMNIEKILKWKHCDE